MKKKTIVEIVNKIPEYDHFLSSWRVGFIWCDNELGDKYFNSYIEAMQFIQANSLIKY